MERTWHALLALCIAACGTLCIAACGDNVQPKILIATVPVPPGAQCPAGGTEIEVGLDRNNDGVLEPDEVESTTYLCNTPGPTVIDGSFTVENSADAAQLVGVTTITGDLTIDANGLTTLDLSSLQTIGGLLEVEAYSGTELHLDALTSVDSIDLRVAVSAFTAPMLAHVNSMLFYQTQLPSLSFPQLFPSLTTLALALGIDANEAMTTLDLSSLQSVGELTIDSNDNVPTVDLSGLRTSQSIGMQGNTTLVTIAANALTSADEIDLENDASLASVSLPALTTSQISITVANLPALTSIALPALTEAGAFAVANDPLLTALQLPAVTAIDGPLVIESNQTLASIALPSLHAAATSVGLVAPGPGVAIESNPVLASVTAPAWTVYGASGQAFAFAIADDPLLPTCAATALAQQVGATNTDLSGDDTAATCP